MSGTEFISKSEFSGSHTQPVIYIFDLKPGPTSCTYSTNDSLFSTRFVSLCVIESTPGKGTPRIRTLKGHFMTGQS